MLIQVPEIKNNVKSLLLGEIKNNNIFSAEPDVLLNLSNFYYSMKYNGNIYNNILQIMVWNKNSIEVKHGLKR